MDMSLHPRACADVDEASVVEAALDPDVAVVAVVAAVVDGARVVIPAWQVKTQKPALKRPQETKSIHIYMYIYIYVCVCVYNVSMMFFTS